MSFVPCWFWEVECCSQPTNQKVTYWLIRLMLPFYILLTGSTYEQLGCNAPAGSFSELEIPKSRGVSVIYTSQVFPKRVQWRDTFLREICCSVPFACLVPFPWESPAVFWWGSLCQELPVPFSRSLAFLEHVLSWLQWVLFRLQTDFWGKCKWGQCLSPCFSVYCLSSLLLA